uniref:Uncharacterized protein n=1 Tax=uncultured bacterium A1Q1_fos_1050 TaxID=1256538 RepID=L7VPY0_9BACT|nr:hypothetical protein [uncultured bacterium A1Q1_fos_1050]
MISSRTQHCERFTLAIDARAKTMTDSICSLLQKTAKLPPVVPSLCM